MTYKNPMNTVKEIEEAVRHLPPNDLKQFREWFETFEAARWDRKFEADIAAGRLDHLAKEAQAEYKAGNTTGRLITQALDLPAALRAFIAEKLIESLDTKPDGILSPAWRQAIQKRSREVADDTADLRNAEEVFKRAQAALK